MADFSKEWCKRYDEGGMNGDFSVMDIFKDLKEGVVTVQMRGACSGCPSSTMTLKAGIEALLKRLLPDAVKEVVSEAL